LPEDDDVEDIGGWEDDCCCFEGAVVGRLAFLEESS
jgi:hypothetical protein